VIVSYEHIDRYLQISHGKFDQQTNFVFSFAKSDFELSHMLAALVCLASSQDPLKTDRCLAVVLVDALFRDV
jgi:hypothetical protein